uniref:Uncharacterized protein n=1 Tax=Myotis lucifugus TaxID=59463 RepID=G1Q9I6_MYOLU
RTRSLHGPCPEPTFEPKACVLRNPGHQAHPGPASQQLPGVKFPRVLVIKKVQPAPALKELCKHVMENNMIVFVEKNVLEDPIGSDDNFTTEKEEHYDDMSNQINSVICRGGDGTLLSQGSPPPGLPLRDPFHFENFQSQVIHVSQGNAATVLRSQLKSGSWRSSERDQRDRVRAADTGKEVRKQVMQYDVLKAMVMDRSPSYLSNMDLYLDWHLITRVHGNNVIISPTGSTVSAATAGAAMSHNMLAIMIMPIYPHSQSFLLTVVSTGDELKIMLSLEARNTRWVSFN